MKVAILGGGFAGLTAAYYLQKKGHSTTIYEKEASLGGLAGGFKTPQWSWSLEHTYHHIFAGDSDILALTKEAELDKFIFKEPETASLYNSRAFPVDTPQDFLRLPVLSWPTKLRVGTILAFLKISPFFSFYETQTAEKFLTKTMGEEGWKILWQGLFRKKFGKYAENVLASFIWARIKKRTKSLGYAQGGFQTLINHLQKKDKSLGAVIEKGTAIDNIKISNSRFSILNSQYDAVISTLPTPILIKIGKDILPDFYLKQLNKIQYLHAVTLILETEKPILDKTYWLNITDEKIPLMAVVQHTNFMDKKHYNNKHLTYIGWYVDDNDKLLQMDKNEVFKFCLPYLKQLTNYELRITNSFLFKTPWAQPIFDKSFLKNKPSFVTPLKNFYIANLDMTYPYDRGINYAVKLGKEAAALVK